MLVPIDPKPNNNLQLKLNMNRQFKYKIKAVFIFCILFSLHALAQDNMNLSQKLGKVDSSNIFVSKDYYTWCSSVIKGDDEKYYM